MLLFIELMTPIAIPSDKNLPLYLPVVIPMEVKIYASYTFLALNRAPIMA